MSSNTDAQHVKSPRKRADPRTVTSPGPKRILQRVAVAPFVASLALLGTVGTEIADAVRLPQQSDAVTVVVDSLPDGVTVVVPESAIDVVDLAPTQPTMLAAVHEDGSLAAVGLALPDQPEVHLGAVSTAAAAVYWSPEVQNAQGDDERFALVAWASQQPSFRNIVTVIETHGLGDPLVGVAVTATIDEMIDSLTPECGPLCLQRTDSPAINDVTVYSFIPISATDSTDVTCAVSDRASLVFSDLMTSSGERVAAGLDAHADSPAPSLSSRTLLIDWRLCKNEVTLASAANAYDEPRRQLFETLVGSSIARQLVTDENVLSTLDELDEQGLVEPYQRDAIAYLTREALLLEEVVRPLTAPVEPTPSTTVGAPATAPPTTAAPVTVPPATQAPTTTQPATTPSTTEPDIVRLTVNANYPSPPSSGDWTLEVTITNYGTGNAAANARSFTLLDGGTTIVPSTSSAAFAGSFTVPAGSSITGTVTFPAPSTGTPRLDIAFVGGHVLSVNL